MDNESRAAFEDWFNPDDSKNYWDCWQASRKQALDGAVERITTLYEADEPPYLVDICKATEESK